MIQVNLSEILHTYMDILFVSLNPPEKSNEKGHYFSGSWSFWNLLLKSGLITKPVKSPLKGDEDVFRKNNINFKQAIFGITDLCPEIVQTQSKSIQIKANQVQRILNIYRIRINRKS